jgi:hypothetical protein
VVSPNRKRLTSISPGYIQPSSVRILSIGLDDSLRELRALEFSSGGGAQAIVSADSLVFLGGFFTAIGSVARTNLAALDLRTNSVAAWICRPMPEILRLAVSDDGLTLFATSISSGNRYERIDSIFAIDIPTAAVKWSMRIDSSWTVSGIAIDGQTLFVGGMFNRIAGIPRRDLARLATLDGSVLPWESQESLISDSLRSDSVVTLGVHNGVLNVAVDRSVFHQYFRSELFALSTADGGVLPWRDTIGGTGITFGFAGNSVLVGRDSTYGNGLLRFLNGASKVEEEISAPSANLISSYPNPFTASTRLEYIRMTAGNLDLEVFDQLGRAVFRTHGHDGSAGSNSIEFDGSALPAGVYHATLLIDGRRFARTIALMR